MFQNYQWFPTAGFRNRPQYDNLSRVQKKHPTIERIKKEPRHQTRHRLPSARWKKPNSCHLSATLSSVNPEISSRMDWPVDCESFTIVYQCLIEFMIKHY